MSEDELYERLCDRWLEGGQVTAQQYSQREYTEEELLAVSDDMIEESRKARENRENTNAYGSGGTDHVVSLGGGHDPKMA